MKLTFNIPYKTQWGEQLHLYLQSGERPQIDLNQSIAMENDGSGHWFTTIEGKFRPDTPYLYIVSVNNRITRKEWHFHHLPDSLHGHVHIVDRWLERPSLQPFYSSAFTRSIFAHHRTSDQPKGGANVCITCEAPTLRKGQCLAMCGDCDGLGAWDTGRARLMRCCGTTWELWLSADELNETNEFKFIVLNEADRSLVTWEDGDNRHLTLNRYNDVSLWIFNAFTLRDNQPHWRGAGVAIPVFSLRSERSFGIGEFSDIPLMVDWAAKTGQCIVQLLPVNDTTMNRNWHESYPYNAISCFALNPAYLRLEEVGILQDAKKMKHFQQEQQMLNALPMVDYDRVINDKWEYLYLIYQQEGEKVLTSSAFQLFYQDNRYWLRPYAVYSYLRDVYKNPDFHSWKECNYSEELVNQFCDTTSEHYPQIAFYFYLQYHLHVQLKHAADYAHKHGVVLKGDIPIGISRTSVEAWCHPELFCLDSQAGAPPDAFAREGQNWGFPTYNWSTMASDGYKWFCARFRKMSDYFDAYRIDHLLGFFRIWEIPYECMQGLLGHFNPAMPLSLQEIEDFGFTFNKRTHVDGCLPRAIIEQIFKDRTEEVIHRFLIEEEKGYYIPAPHIATQRRVLCYLGEHPEDEALREGLLQLHTEVLFLEDPCKSGYYHPRIKGFDTLLFKRLDESQRKAYYALHDHFFYRRHNDFWYQEAMKKLPAILDSTDMLVCGEDLGMIPACVPAVMKELNILSLEIQRMPKTYGCSFDNPQNYPYYSVCTTSTHDMSGIRGWWEEDPMLTQRYFNDMLRLKGKAPATCENWICENIVFQHLSSPAMLTILPWQDWLSIDNELRYPDVQAERINVPSNPYNYWRYRMHLTLEQLLEEKDLNDKIHQLIRHAGR